MSTTELTATPAPMSPAEELATLVGWATMLFFAVENGENPSVRTIADAYHYVTTALSVGYANIFPVTSAGKIIGGVVMTLGPALSGMALEGKAERGEGRRCSGSSTRCSSSCGG